MRRQVLEAGPFDFEAGGHLDNIRIVYHTSDREYKAGDKVVWICHALTANSDVSDWWPQLVGPGQFVDPDKFFVVCVSMIASPYGECSPAAIDPKTGKPYLFDFPMTTVRDMVSAEIMVRKALGIEHIDLLLGCSIGGFQAVEWAVTEPDIFGKALFFATSPRVSPWLSAGVEAQRMALEADPTFREAKSLEGGREGLKCSRAQALISYRCFEGYALRQSEPDEDVLFAGRAASYERHQGLKITQRGFDAYSYWYLCFALDSHNVGRHRGGVASALARIKAKTTVIAIDSDGLFPLSEMKAMAQMIPGADMRIITSSFGHDGFLLEYPQLTEILAPIIHDIK